MEFIQLGHTGLSVSRLALGCMSYGSSKWRPWVLDEDAARPFFRKAVESGINFFDTADMYSLGASEEVTGRAVRELTKRDETVLATKVYWPATPGPNMSGLSRKHVVQACEASLRRLGVDVIDLYYIHRFDPHTPIEEALEALNDLVRWGKVRYLGASSGPAWRMAQALSESERNGWARFVAMQNHYNLVYREEEREMIPLCNHQGVGLVPWSPIARGMLARPRPTDAKIRSAGTARARNDAYSESLYDNPADWNVVTAVERVASKRGSSMAEVALAWLLSRPGVAAPVVGATRMEHLDTALSALKVSLTAEECAELEAPYVPHEVRGFAFPEPQRQGVARS
ncbi:MAG TPA: aldo/keto reductase [Gemmatimonadaceae bacterium]|nr:aldo/keto reductase [Gemmatimonadaceae bacterium]